MVIKLNSASINQIIIEEFHSKNYIVKSKKIFNFLLKKNSFIKKNQNKKF